MRISDWSSDVCSSDLGFQHRLPVRLRPVEPFGKGDSIGKAGQGVAQHLVAQAMLGFHFGGAVEIGRASCRDRVCQSVSISVVAVSLKTKSLITYNQQFCHPVPYKDTGQSKLRK